MFEIFGQPKSYSDTLKRIFAFTFLVGLGCSAVLAWQSPDAKKIIDSFKLEGTAGPITTNRILLIAIPFVVALVSRIIKLHDRVSDLFRIRARFDQNHLLLPLAKGVDFNIDTYLIINRRLQNKLLSKVFYEWASFTEPKITKQLVATAADNWAWLWVFIEATVLLVLSAIISIALLQWKTGLFFGLAGVSLTFFAWCMYRACVKSANPQITEILSDDNRRRKIKYEFINALQN